MHAPLLAIVGVALLMAGPAAAPAPGAEAVGFVRNAQGGGVVRRGSQDIAVHEGLGLLEGDVVATAPDGRVGLLFHDDTRVGLGAASEVQIVRFRFQPTRDELAFVIRITRGAVAYISGKIATFGSGRVRIETPVGVVGVRGTAFAVRIDAE